LKPQDAKVVQQLRRFVFQVWVRGGPGREELLRLLEGARDAEETGELGRQIVTMSISTPTQLRAAEDPAQARTEGVKMLERARALDPSNAKWAVGLELARLGQLVRIQGVPALSRDEVEKVGSPVALLRLRVGSDGAVREAVALEGPAALLAPAVQSAKKVNLEARGSEYDAAGMVIFVPPPRRISVEPENPPPAKRITVGGNVMNVMLAEKVEPEYPPAARAARIQGMVRFTAIIAKDGGVANLTLVSGHPLLIQAAVDAVKQWKYKPTMLNGEAVEVVTQIDVPFTLQQ